MKSQEKWPTYLQDPSVEQLRFSTWNSGQTSRTNCRSSTRSCPSLPRGTGFAQGAKGVMKKLFLTRHCTCLLQLKNMPKRSQGTLQNTPTKSSNVEMVNDCLGGCQTHRKLHHWSLHPFKYSGKALEPFQKQHRLKLPRHSEEFIGNALSTSLTPVPCTSFYARIQPHTPKHSSNALHDLCETERCTFSNSRNSTDPVRHFYALSSLPTHFH